MPPARAAKSAARRTPRLLAWLLAWLLGCLLIAPLAVVAAPSPAPAGVPPGASLYLEALTWTELAARVAGGATTVLLPIGGTEQGKSGPHMVLGKHNVRAHALAGRIAQALGQTLVAPVLAYVPEGAIDPPAAHMRYAGTISISEAAFEAVIEGAARSLRRHGFRDIVLLGDHGGYQASLQRVTTRLNREWAAGGKVQRVRVHALGEYYVAAQTGFAQWLAARGFGAAEIGRHAGLADTSLALAVDPGLVRLERLAGAQPGDARDGVDGDPRRATAALGEAGAALIVERSVAAIRQRLAAR